MTNLFKAHTYVHPHVSRSDFLNNAHDDQVMLSRPRSRQGPPRNGFVLEVVLTGIRAEATRVRPMCSPADAADIYAATSHSGGPC
jgi:hypothetical protein